MRIWKTGRKWLASLLIAVLIFSMDISAIKALAVEINTPDVTVIQNDFIKVTVDNATGRFGIRTVEGQPIRKKDQNVNMLFRGDDPETSFTTFRINGTDYIFGNPYKFAADFFSEITTPQIVQNRDGTRQIETTWKIEGVEIKQILKLDDDITDKQNAGNVQIRYEVNNQSGAEVTLGSRILLDTMVGGNDGPLWQIGKEYKVPLMVERKFVHNPENDPGIPENDRAYYKLPPYWVMRDNLDFSNPLATNVIAYGFNNFFEKNVNIVDEIIVAHWNGLANTKWDYTVNPNLDFTRDTNDFGTADSAVALYWQPEKITKGGTQAFETVYGLGEIIEPDKVFSIRFMDTVEQLDTLDNGSAYKNDGVFDVIAEIENLAMFNMEHSRLEIELTLENGLDFVKVDDQGQIVKENGKPAIENYRSRTLTFRKEATPEEAAAGIQPKYVPGDIVTASFKVMAKGKPWPSTREYLVTVRSPETLTKIENIEDEGIKAQYESSKANFIFLPPVGEAYPTYVYGMSPEETYNSDIKYITLNMSNIEAYNPGSAVTEPNFDLYFTEIFTGNRYKVPVRESVLIQPTDEGSIGDMRITYRGGDLVDASGNPVMGEDSLPMTGLGPDLPLGEYAVEIDYHGDTGDEEEAAIYDLITTQTFLVTDNDEARVREANILAVYREDVNLTQNANTLLEQMDEIYPGNSIDTVPELVTALGVFDAARSAINYANTLMDPEFDFDFLDLAATPAYNIQVFATEDELQEFKDNLDGEVLAEIRGMVKEIGSGEDRQFIVDTKTEPAIINKAAAYRGKDLVFVRGQLDLAGLFGNVIPGYDQIPFLNTIFIKGDGTLSVASSGFVFHQGEWTLDFYNGFMKSLGDNNYTLPPVNVNPEDDSLNGALSWAVGALGDRMNPLRQIMIGDVYFNRQSLFAAPNFSIAGFGLTFKDFILREGGISFGGAIYLKIINSEIKNVVFNDKGFVGIDANLNFKLEQDMGLLEPTDAAAAPAGNEAGGENGGNGGENGEEPGSIGGSIQITHYVQDVGKDNEYGVSFAADLKNMLPVSCELSLKQVADGRILPDVIGFGAGLGDPGVLVYASTYITAIRGAIRELADTIAGGTNDIPLTLEAGADIDFGQDPAEFTGAIDLTLKKTSLQLEGSFALALPPDDTLEMLTYALIKAQWVTPWFIRAEAELDVGGWDVIVGEAKIFIGQNLEKNRTDFEGFVSAGIQIPSKVPIVGGKSLASARLGANNDKLWGGVRVLIVNLGITYYWGSGDISFASGEGLPDGLIYLLVEEPEKEPCLMVIGEGVKTVATSWKTKEEAAQGIIYRSVAEGISMIDTGAMSLGIGGITAENKGKTHRIPIDDDVITGNALIEVEYFENKIPDLLMLLDPNGLVYPISIDDTNTKPDANAFTQYIPAGENDEGVDIRRLYIAIPHNKLKDGTWTLSSEQPMETKLMNTPIAAELEEVTLTQDAANSNKFTAAWQVAHTKPGDTVNLYLTENAITNETTTFTKANGEEVEILKSGEPGLLIAKDISVDQNGGTSGNITNGNTIIDVTAVSLLGNTEDIRGLLKSGEYYLRAELKSSLSFDTKTSVNRFELIDPLAPAKVNNVQIQPVGNGFFELSFEPAAKKTGQENFEHSYLIEVLHEENGVLTTYPNYGEVLFNEEELAEYWNAQSDKYEGIRIGGWTLVSRVEENETKYTGLEVGEEYVAGVSAVTKPPKEVDKNENYHFGKRTDSVKTLLPIPNKPKLTEEPFLELWTNETEQSVNITADQADVEVEAFNGEQSLGKIQLTNNGSGSTGTFNFTNFTTDGTYAIELRARNKNTGDFSVTMLYLTVDTIAPIIFIDQPKTGDRTSDGTIAVAGTTSIDATLSVNGTEIDVAEDGKFSGTIAVNSEEPTVKLEFAAIDRVGNNNRALVSVTNDDFKVPLALVLEKMPALEIDQTEDIEVSLRFADGKDASGKPKYKEVAIPEEELGKLSFLGLMGEAVDVTENGQVTALQEGAGIISANFMVSEDVSLESIMVVKVKSPEDPIESISLSASAVSGKNNKTKITVTDTGDLTGCEFVYMIYPKDSEDVLPLYHEDLWTWSVLPSNGEITVKAGDIIVIAKRTKENRLALAASSITAVVGSEGSGTGGPGGGGGGPVTEPATPGEVLVNNQPLAAEKKDGLFLVNVGEQDVNTLEKNGLSLTAQDETVDGYEFNISKELHGQVVSHKQNINIETSLAQIRLTSSQVAGTDQDIVVKVTKNSNETSNSLNAMARSLNVNVLGSGAGITFYIGIPEVNKDHYISTRVTVPDDVNASDISAVVLRDDQGNWTTLPWQLDSTGDKAYVDVLLTGNGSIAFLQNNSGFGDVPHTFWGAESINEAAGKLFVLGKNKDVFDPQSNVTRAELPTILLRVAGLMNKDAREGFTDVTEKDWFIRSVAIACQKGIIKGYDDATFKPEAKVSRIEAMVMVGRALRAVGISDEIQELEIDSILSSFNDKDAVPEWARKEAALCIKYGVIMGENSQINPETPLSRAQAAAIAIRMDKLISAKK